MRRRMPMFLALFFIALTTRRVASFAGDEIVSWLFAIGITCGVFLASYYLRYKDTKNAAVGALLFLVIVDGIFNLSEVLRWSQATGRWDITNDLGSLTLYPYRIGDIIYGLFPTIASVLLGILAGRAAQIPSGGKRSGSFKRRAGTWLADTVFGAEDIPEAPQIVPALAAPNAESNGRLPEWLPFVPESKRQFLDGVRQGSVVIPKDATGEELAEYVQVGPRAARNWISEGRRALNGR